MYACVQQFISAHTLDEQVMYKLYMQSVKLNVVSSTLSSMCLYILIHRLD